MYLVISLRRPVLLLAVAAMIIGCVSTAGYAFVTSYLSGDTIVSGVKVASINVGGLTIQEAAAYLSAIIWMKSSTGRLPLSMTQWNGGFRPTIPASHRTWKAYLLAPFQVGRQGNLPAQARRALSKSIGRLGHSPHCLGR